ncbi:MAG: hypothetical protein ACRDOK_25590 [Streptosporangiaceae bacterium]
MTGRSMRWVLRRLWPQRVRLRFTLRRLWPQRVRLRLTLLYAGLFLVAGGALLGLTYGLVAASLPTSSPTATSSRYYDAQRAVAGACKAPYKGLGKPPRASPAAILKCKQASDYIAGVQAGTQSQRDRALHSLLLYSLLGLGVMTVASGGAGWFVSGRVVRRSARSQTRPVGPRSSISASESACPDPGTSCRN